MYLTHFIQCSIPTPLVYAGYGVTEALSLFKDGLLPGASNKKTVRMAEVGGHHVGCDANHGLPDLPDEDMASPVHETHPIARRHGSVVDMVLN